MTSSVISFSKRDVSEFLPGMQVALYELPSSPEGTILHIEDSFYYKPDLNGEQDQVRVDSAQIAESIVKMHTTSQLCYIMGQHPAIFAVPNIAVTPEMLKKEYKDLVSHAKAAQIKWFIALVRLADDDWTKHHNNQMIAEIQRIAAKELNLKREWLIELTDAEEGKVDCPFCGSGLLNPSAPICPNCQQVHNPVAFKALQAKLGVTLAGEAKKVQ